MAEKPVSISSHAVERGTLAALLEASAAMNDSLDLATVLQAIAASAAEVLRAEASSVLLLDAGRKKLVFRAATGSAGERLVGQELDAKQGIAGLVASTGVPKRVPDVYQHPDFFAGFDEKSQFQTRGLIAAPMKHHGQVVGVVEV